VRAKKIMMAQSTSSKIDELFSKAKLRLGRTDENTVPLENVRDIPLTSKVEGLEKYLGLEELLKDPDEIKFNLNRKSKAEIILSSHMSRQNGDFTSMQ
jgi:hypothetical protein